MAAIIPAKLKTADVQRFATRAAQLEKYRPIVSYWCEYYILQVILNKQLHTTDDETQNYAIQLMDKLESYKSANNSNDAVIDDVAAKAYIENFALETFAKADDSQRANKVTRQTADTFQAAATFLDLLSIWSPPEREVASKSKFAKFHALRIAKALKAGEDPNATNPKMEELPKPKEDGIDAELRELGDSAPSTYRPPTIESAPDSVQPSRPGSTLQGEPGAPPVLIPDNINEPLAQDASEVSPIEPADATNNRTGSIGGGYFPSVPLDTGDYQTSPEAPSAAPEVDVNANSIDDVPQIPSVPRNQPGSDPSTFYTAQPSPPSAPSEHFDKPEGPPPDLGYTQSPYIPLSQPQATQPRFTAQAPRAPPVPSQASQPPPPVPISTGPPPGGYNTDDESVVAAQKHAKWAISALNFEDVPTAVKELKFALQKLGAL